MPGVTYTNNELILRTRCPIPGTLGATSVFLRHSYEMHCRPSTLVIGSLVSRPVTPGMKASVPGVSSFLAGQQSDAYLGFVLLEQACASATAGLLLAVLLRTTRPANCSVRLRLFDCLGKLDLRWKVQKHNATVRAAVMVGVFAVLLARLQHIYQVRSGVNGRA